MNSWRIGVHSGRSGSENRSHIPFLEGEVGSADVLRAAISPVPEAGISRAVRAYRQAADYGGGSSVSLNEAFFGCPAGTRWQVSAYTTVAGG